MIMRKSIGAALACALALGAWSGSALSAPITVGGITWDPANGSDLTIQSLNLRETTVSTVGDVLHGYGQIGSINGDNAFCASCDLVFTFNYTLRSLAPGQAVFDNGGYQFYVVPHGTFNFGNPSSANGAGTPWLILSGHTAPRTGFTDPDGQLYATINGTTDNPQSGSGGNGLVDATGGVAMPYMDTNLWSDGIGGHADFNLVSSFSVFPWNTCTTVTTNLDDVCSYPIQGNGSLTGKSTIPVPEPGAIGLLGLGLGFLGLFAWRRSKESDGRA